MNGLKTWHACLDLIYIFETVYKVVCLFVCFLKIREVSFSIDFLKCINLISIEFLTRNTLLHKFLRTCMIFFYQFIVILPLLTTKTCVNILIVVHADKYHNSECSEN